VKSSDVTSLASHLLVDAWPVMEWIQQKEPAARAFAALIEAAIRGETKLSMSRINHGEVVYLIRKNFPTKAAQALSEIRDLPIDLLSVSDQLIDAAVDLKSVYAISFADAFAVAHAMQLALPLITGDRDLLPLRDAGLLQLHWLGA